MLFLISLEFVIKIDAFFIKVYQAINIFVIWQNHQEVAIPFLAASNKKINEKKQQPLILHFSCQYNLVSKQICTDKCPSCKYFYINVPNHVDFS